MMSDAEEDAVSLHDSGNCEREIEVAIMPPDQEKWSLRLEELTVAMHGACDLLKKELLESSLERDALSSRIESVDRQVMLLIDKINHVVERMSVLTSPVASPSKPEAPGDSAASVQKQPAFENALEKLLLGEALCNRSSLEQTRRHLIDCVIAKRDEAVRLAGRLLLIQTAPAEELPNLLKEIGEAFYAWLAKTPEGEGIDELWAKSLVDALHQRIATAGLRNSIQLVQPGDRYDAARHNTTDRGVEVKTVGGWIVLRENGKPLTKASVTLR